MVVRGKGLGQGSWARTTLRQSVVVRADSNEQGSNVKYNTEFGYSRKDVLLICGGLIALGYALYYGLQALGMEAGYAGNWVQLIIFMGICVGWVSTYIYRVATKVRGAQGAAAAQPMGSAGAVRRAEAAGAHSSHLLCVVGTAIAPLGPGTPAPCCRSGLPPLPLH